MTITKAIEHFQFKFQKVWKGTEKDNEAMKSIIDFVNEKHKKQLFDNELFAKLYIYSYATFLKHYNTTVFDPIPQKELHKFLSQPTEKIIKQFVKRLNESDLYQRLEKIDKRDNFYQKVTFEAPGLDFYNETWDYDSVKNDLETQINLAINEL